MSQFEEAMIVTERLSLVPLRPEDADEMAVVLGDGRLHEFIGGRPLTGRALRVRYVKLSADSPDHGELWRNWIIRRRSDATAVGTVQVTLSLRDSKWTALVAWVVGGWIGSTAGSHQRRRKLWSSGSGKKEPTRWLRTFIRTIARPPRSRFEPGSSRPTIEQLASGCGALNRLNRRGRRRATRSRKRDSSR